MEKAEQTMFYRDINCDRKSYSSRNCIKARIKMIQPFIENQAAFCYGHLKPSTQLYITGHMSLKSRKGTKYINIAF